MANFISLPREVYLLIAEDLDQPSLNNLAQTSRGFYNLLNAELYWNEAQHIKRWHLVGSRALSHLCTHGHLRALELLIEFGVSINKHVHGEKYTPPSVLRYPICHAALNGHVEMVKFLLEKQSPIYTCLRMPSSMHVQSTLHAAIDGGSEEVVRMLLEKFPDALDYRDYIGLPPLHHAVRSAKLPMVRVLVSAGANIGGLTSRSLNTALHKITRANKFPELQSEIMDFIIQSGGDINEVNRSGATPLNYVCSYGDSRSLHILPVLIAKGADVNKPDHSSNTPLLNLMEHNPSHPTARDRYNENAFYTALDCLISNGADLNCQTMESRETALHIAVRDKEIQAIQMFLAAGAKTDIKDTYERTALHLAERKGDAIRELFGLPPREIPKADPEKAAPADAAVAETDENSDTIIVAGTTTNSHTSVDTNTTIPSQGETPETPDSGTGQSILSEIGQSTSISAGNFQLDVSVNSAEVGVDDVFQDAFEPMDEDKDNGEIQSESSSPLNSEDSDTVMTEDALTPEDDSHGEKNDAGSDNILDFIGDVISRNQAIDSELMDLDNEPGMMTRRESTIDFRTEDFPVAR